MFTMTETSPVCPYCRCDRCTLEVGDFFCPTCGAEFDRHTAIVMERLEPYYRAERIGGYHARGNWDYLWCAPEFTREELRGYARGFLAAAHSTNNTLALWLHGERANRDASWRD